MIYVVVLMAVVYLGARYATIGAHAVAGKPGGSPRARPWAGQIRPGMSES